jgi:transcriptional regulator with XRE-family HTH domain
MMRPAHLRMARAALNWTVRELARRAAVDKNAVSRFESGKQILSASLQSIEDVLAKEGVVFLEDSTSVGVRILL